jgi:hypothetical protein
MTCASHTGQNGRRPHWDDLIWLLLMLNPSSLCGVANSTFAGGKSVHPDGDQPYEYWGGTALIGFVSPVTIFMTVKLAIPGRSLARRYES